jgi:cell division protein ZapA
MSQVTIIIGGRSFEVVCHEGEEEFLQSAAGMLDEEAQKLDGAGSRITESRMLLMAGLLLADRTAATEEKLATMDRKTIPHATDSEAAERARDAEAKLRAAEVDMAAVKAQLSEAQNALEMRDQSDTAVIDRLRMERDDAIATLRQIVNKVQSVANA